MISFILLNNLNFSCCIGYPHAHMSTRKCLVNYHSWNVGVWSMVLTWPYPPNTAQMPALFASFRFTCLILQLRSSVLNLDWMPPRNWRHLCKSITSNYNKFISRHQCNQRNSMVPISTKILVTIVVHVEPQASLIM